MYTVQNFTTKKVLKDAVTAWNAAVKEGNTDDVEAVTLSKDRVDFGEIPQDGIEYVEGPHYPKARKSP